MSNKEPELVRILSDTLHSLVGRSCCQMFFGPTTGTVLDLDFSPLVPRPYDLPNRSLSESAPTQTGELSLFIECAWRVIRHQRIVCTSAISSQDISLLKNVEEAIVFQEVVGIGNLDTSCLDLTILFANATSLNLFCDCFGTDASDNYSIFSPNGIITVDHDLCIHLDPTKAKT